MTQALRVTVTPGDHDVTEGVKIMYDAVVASMDWGSGMLDTEAAAKIVQVGLAAGFFTPDNAREQFESYLAGTSTTCAVCGQRIWWEYHRKNQARPNWYHSEALEPTDHAPVLAELAEFDTAVLDART